MKKSETISGMNFGTEFLSNLYKKVVKLGGSEEQMFDAMKTESPLIEKWAKDIVDIVSSFKLKFLKLIQSGISVVSKSFNKKDFFTTNNGPVRFWFGDNFKSWILPEISEVVPEFSTVLTKLELTKSLNDSGIRPEIGESNVVSPDEWAAEFKELISTQPTGEKGILLVNGYSNIRYVRLSSGRVVAVDAYWNADCCGWCLDASVLDDYRWGGGDGVFARS